MQTTMRTGFTQALQAEQIPYKLEQPLKQYTTFRVGGACTVMVLPQDNQQVQTTLQLLKKHQMPYRILGNGSNVLVSDQGFDGAIVLFCGNHASITDLGDGRLCVTAGVLLSSLCNYALKQGLTGLEFAYGIPATVGGGVYMNAGAYGGELADIIQSVTYLDEDGSIQTKPVQQLEFGYRHSYFSHTKRVVLSMDIQLTADDPAQIKARMVDVLSRRKEKQPLEYGSAGSTFKRPTGYFAGKLIEDAGLKGKIIGGAQVSEKHAGFIINRGNATAEDICQLMAEVTQQVQHQFGVTLQPEVEWIGEQGECSKWK